MNTQINVNEILVDKAAALVHNVSQEDIVAIALRELIDTTNRKLRNLNYIIFSNDNVIGKNTWKAVP